MADEQPVAAPQYTAAQLIDYYIKLRDKKKVISERHAKELSPINALMSQLDGMMLKMCQDMGTDSIKDKTIGTATKAVSVGASIREPEIFRQFVIDSQAWDMVNWSANKEACEAYVAANKQLPPGVVLSSFEHMNVRRASSNKAIKDE